MTAVLCSFQPGVKGNALLKFLDALFSAEKDLEERRKVLEEEYGITDDEVEGTMRRMCNLSEGIYEEGRQEGLREGRQEGLQEGEIKGAIKIYSDEMHLTPEEIIKRLMVRFSLEEGVATQYVEKALNLQTA